MTVRLVLPSDVDDPAKIKMKISEIADATRKLLEFQDALTEDSTTFLRDLLQAAEEALATLAAQAA